MQCYGMAAVSVSKMSHIRPLGAAVISFRAVFALVQFMRSAHPGAGDILCGKVEGH